MRTTVHQGSVVRTSATIFSSHAPVGVGIGGDDPAVLPGEPEQRLAVDVFLDAAHQVPEIDQQRHLDALGTALMHHNKRYVELHI